MNKQLLTQALAGISRGAVLGQRLGKAHRHLKAHVHLQKPS